MQAELQALRVENGGYRRKLETTMQRLELSMQQVCILLPRSYCRHHSIPDGYAASLSSAVTFATRGDVAFRP